METSEYTRFIKDCIAADTAKETGLTEDQLYGVYLSWCGLHRQPPTTCESFSTEMANLGLSARRQDNHRTIWPGLRMTGPAALDYILTSQPSLV
ncbi:hypothetical protein QFZ70_000320 [Arthrobacter sp. V1I9]|jgi:hypothetical protein|uniref:hypothetical protein n=1 Tax=Arthrobacter sp. V1I9 TaxID=3042275 RepID=UPI00278CBD06|nr:hypothetical protein [Arthrobacter sp. V1I9]MDQ0867847.1 hypothetical protein [Arthrobacter sp. V1I9]